MSTEHLEREALRLASELTVAAGGRARPVMPRVRDNGRVLLRCYLALARVVHERGPVPPAAEWLVDNFMVVESALRLVRNDLPRGFYRQLPRVAVGSFEGYPRVLALMDAFASLTDSRFDASVLRQFVDACQRVEPLTIGELWAVPITLCMTLVEQLRLLAVGIEISMRPDGRGRDLDAAKADVSVRNIITSLRALAAFEVADFFESVSHVDAVLRAGSDFGAMDFPSRDRYRH